MGVARSVALLACGRKGVGMHLGWVPGETVEDF